jgi:hypothetical protein
MQNPSDDLRHALSRLETDGLVARQGESLRTTGRWQGAMARVALRLYEAGDPGQDLRVPIAHAMIEMYPDVSDEELAALVEAILPIELSALGVTHQLSKPVE